MCDMHLVSHVWELGSGPAVRGALEPLGTGGSSRGCEGQSPCEEGQFDYCSNRRWGWRALAIRGSSPRSSLGCWTRS